jgi:hypothetical protein
LPEDLGEHETFDERALRAEREFRPGQSGDLRVAEVTREPGSVT